MKLKDRLEMRRSSVPADSGEESRVLYPSASVVIDAQQRLKERVRSQAIEMLYKEKNPDSSMVKAALNEVLQYEAEDVPRPERTRIAEELMNDIIGYGPLETLLRDADVTEIMINGPFRLYVEIKGKIYQMESPFRDNDHLNNIIDRIVSSIGRHVDESSPMVDARLKDGSRVNVIIPPLSLVGPVITIRKFAKIPYTDKDLIEFGSVSHKMMSFLEACIKGRLSVVISGGTGSGKTTFLNVLSGYIPSGERIVTIEDAAEIRLKQEHVVTLESRPPNIEGSGEVTIRDLVRNALRMRPDRIIVGEVRSGEALDMLQAMNTGHDGSITTVHANSPRDALARIETMALMAGMDLPVHAIRNQIASAINIMVHLSRLRDGTRRVTSIMEITGIETDVITMQELFAFETQGKTDSQGRFLGRFKPTGIVPYCLEKLRYHGVSAFDDWFVQ
ncbi:MAG: putative conjugal transfer protein [Firmicutes bacterium ADurb.Bin182]|nr:MAG: putative conjugal transfer protein [Firmicutes bacterium ADurb.Bin182]